MASFTKAILRMETAALAVALAGLIGSSPVQAQDTSGAKPKDCASADGSGCAGDDGTITVTGSRIRLRNFQSSEPTSTITAAYLEDRGLTNAADALNELPGIRGSVTPNGSQASFGQGVNFINSYGLGSNRTLTLLNGRRVVSSNVTTIFGNASPGTQVDLNTIPTILIDRIDRVAIGGAPVYGSDAIAGTVNIVLKNKLQGLDLRATGGVTDRGDGYRWNVQAAGGFSFGGGRGQILGAVSYEQVDGILYNARDFYRANLGNATNPTSAQAAAYGPVGRSSINDGRINPSIGYNNSPTDGYPGSVLVKDLSIYYLTRGGEVISGSKALGLMFDPSGNLVPFNKGIVYPSIYASGGDGFRFSDYSQLTSDITRTNVFLSGSYEMSDNVKVFFEGMYYSGYGNELVQQPTFNTNLFSGVSGALTFRVDNPFLTQQAKDTLAANGYTSTFSIGRANVDLADLTGYSKNALYRGVLGLSGDFNIGHHSWNWEVSTTFGHNNFDDHNQNINQQNFVNAINAVNSGGQIVCSTTQVVTGTPTGPIADPNCVPLNLFGEGAPSAAAKAYIIQNTLAHSELEEWVVNANIGGGLFDLFGNTVAINGGYEHREESGKFRPDAFLRAGLGRSVAISPTSGNFTLNELFGEALVPLIEPSNNFVFSKLEAFGRIRYVHNSVNGSFTAWAAGGSFAPIEDIEFRGNFTRSFRAPAIVELFSPRTNIFTFVPDLCSAANRNAGPVPTIRNANCTAFLNAYPGATPLLAAAATVPGISGGNPSLGNEIADSFTYGVIVRPRFIPRLSVSADYLNIKLTNPISSLSVATIASACFDNPDFNTADPANGNPFCSLIKRDSTGQVVNDPLNPGVTTGYVNGKVYRFSGIQGVLDYWAPLSGIGLPGKIEVGADVFYLKNRLIDITGVAPARSDGLLGDPKFQAQLRLRYFNSVWGVSTNVNYVGKQLISLTQRGTQPNDAREFDHFHGFATVDMSLWIQTKDKLKLTLAVTNVTDRIGQAYYGYIIPASVNDPFGRRYTLTVSKRF